MVIKLADFYIRKTKTYVILYVSLYLIKFDIKI